jgi:hypothetical protein
MTSAGINPAVDPLTWLDPGRAEEGLVRASMHHFLILAFAGFDVAVVNQAFGVVFTGSANEIMLQTGGLSMAYVLLAKFTGRCLAYVNHDVGGYWRRRFWVLCGFLLYAAMGLAWLRAEAIGRQDRQKDPVTGAFLPAEFPIMHFVVIAGFIGMVATAVVLLESFHYNPMLVEARRLRMRHLWWEFVADHRDTALETTERKLEVLEEDENKVREGRGVLFAGLHALFDELVAVYRSTLIQAMGDNEFSDALAAVPWPNLTITGEEKGM